ncbi:MAG: copper resistance protein CopC [Actinophytocola sp.]|uniref:copper resistance CopC family protein n=1 Tax=Actinophytocola sp. TaxID=1872138 RepID=UPI001326287E|nr:copper resistance CopC family protein [Actinophytocola sp.]MPZ81383.1 copper resistance protein CopC [Actinophytocola sp.]
MRKLAVVIGVAFLALLGLATPAFAHNSLVSSNPADQATVQESPSTVELTFDQPVQNGDGLNTITVSGPEQTSWTTGAVDVESNVISASLDELGPAGAYRIAYRIVSADGHPVTGEVTFTLAAAGNGTPVTGVPNAGGTGGGGTAGGSSDGDGLPIWVWIVGAVVVLGAGLTVALRIGGKQPQ